MSFCNVCKNATGSDMIPGEHIMKFRQLQVAAISGCRWCSMLMDTLDAVIDKLSNVRVICSRPPFPVFQWQGRFGAESDSRYSGHLGR